MKEPTLIALSARILQLTQSNKELQLGLTHHDDVNRVLETKGKSAALLLVESRHLQKQLQEMARRLLMMQEDGRKKMSLQLQDEIVQTLEGIHLRLLVLNKEVSTSSEGFKKEIAITQDLVLESVKVINRFAKDSGIQYEK